jgi:PAS domain S-box-containing protein
MASQFSDLPVLKILFLEDIPTDVEIAVRELKKEGIIFSHEVANDRAGYIEKLSRFSPDIVISDFMLPTINGLEALQISHEVNNAIPVIILTGSMDEETAVKCMKAGASDYVVKDFIVKLPFAVRESLHRKQTMMELNQKTIELDAYFTNALDLFCIADTEGYFLRLNQAWETTLGYTLAEMEGVKLLEFIHPDDLKETINALTRLNNDEQILNFINRYRCKDGSYKFIEWRSRPQGDRIYAAARDITERIEQEKLLEEDRERYRLLFESNPLPMWVYRLDSLAFVAVNEAAIRKYGYSEKEFLSMNLNHIRPEEDVHLLMENIKSATDDYETSGAWRHKLKDGSLINVEIISHGLIFDGLKCRMVMSNDITQRVRDEKEIRKLNRLYSVLSNVNQSIVRIKEKQELLNEICRVIIEYGKFRQVWFGETDDSGKTVLVLSAAGLVSDPSIERTHSLDDLLKSDAPCALVLESFSPVISNDLSNFKCDCPIHEKSVLKGTGSLACFPIEIPGNNRGVMCLYASENEFFDQTETALIKELTTDISFALETIENEKSRRETLERLTKSEARYRRFFDEDLTADYISTMNGTLIDCNNAYVRMFGFNDSEHALATNAVELYDNPGDREAYIRLVKEKGSVERHEITYNTIHGEKLHAILNSFGHFDENGNLVRIQGYIFDITEIKKAEKEIIEARELAESSNKLKDAFIANISHEIRTPMNAILGFNTIIRESLIGQVDEEITEYFGVVDDAGARLMRTVDLILSLSKLQAGIIETRQIEFCPDTAIQKIISQHQPASTKKGLPVRYRNNSGVTGITTDEYCFTEVISNLIDNAIKYTEKGSVEVTLELTGERNLEIQVTDTGIGIDKNFQSKIFQPFIQEETGYSRSYEGVGLGLSIVRRFADLAGYRIELESEKGKGSKFIVIIPSKLITGQTKPIERVPITDKTRGPAREFSKKQSTAIETSKSVIFAVEDDEDSKVYLEAVLSGKYDIEVISSDAELFTLLNKRLPDVILMDIALKGSERDGLEITRVLKADSKYSHIPVIAVTAYAFQIDKKNAFEAGCNGFLTKPYTPWDLYKLIEKEIG